MTLQIDFQTLRDQWALKAPLPTEDRMKVLFGMDRNLNPHNDSYKPELRSSSELISDESYKFADEVLKRQYGCTYVNWLRQNRYEDRPHGRGVRHNAL